MTAKTCPKCNGTGKYNYRFQCFRCNGLGQIPATPVAALGQSVSAQVDKVVDALNLAHKNGIENPILRLGEYKVSLARKDSKNPGAIYIKAGQDYFGKIMNHQFFPTAACTAVRVKEITDLIADPFMSAVAYGKKTKRCAICGITLTNPVSVAHGIGPICAGKYGWSEMFSAEEVESDVVIPDDVDMSDLDVLGVK